MSNPEELGTIVERIVKGVHTDGDIRALRQMLSIAVASGDRSVAINGDANRATISTGNTIVNIAIQADGLRIDDRVFRGNGAEALRSLLQETLQPQLSIDWQQASRWCLNQQIEHLTSTVLTHDEGIVHHTDRVHVPLGLVKRKSQSRRGEDIYPEQGSLLYEETEIIEKFEYAEFLERVLRQEQYPENDRQRIVIIGEPGAGKTTLLQQIARWVSKNIDEAIAIWISLADLQGQSIEDYLLAEYLEALVRQQGQAAVSDRLKDKFVSQFQQGRVWLLLDGADEMQCASGNPSHEIERQLKIGGLLSQARIILTCRLNLWDGSRHEFPLFDIYRTLVFAYPQQVEQFIRQWFELLPAASAGTAERLCAALQQSGQERIRDLVKNPLMLTLLCFNWHVGEGTLPETKASLYEQFALDRYEWKQTQFPTTMEQRRQLNAALGSLARDAIDREKIRFRLSPEFISNYLGDLGSSDSLFDLALKLGWLNRVGVEIENPRKVVYAFPHPTFQEYFAATAIDDWHFFLHHFPDEQSHPEASYRVFESQWKEVFLLWLGNPSESLEKYQNDLIQSLIDFKDGCGDYYTIVAMLLAVSGLAEFKKCDRADLHIDEVSKLCFGCLDDSNQKWQVYPDPIPWMAEAALLETDSERFVDIITNKIVPAAINDLHPNKDAAIKSAKILGLLGRDRPNAITALIQLIQCPDFPNRQPPVEFFYFVRVEAAESLVKIASGNDRAIRDLKNLLSEDRDEEIQKLIVTTIGKLSPHDRFAIDFFSQKIDSAVTDRDKLSAAWSILSFNDRHDLTIDTLSNLVHSSDDDVAKTSVELLEQGATITYGSKEIQYSQAEIDEAEEIWINTNSIFDLLCDPYQMSNLVFLWAVQEILDAVKIDYSSIVVKLCERLDTYKDIGRLQTILEILGKISVGDKNVVIVLINFLKNNEILLGFTVRTFYQILDGVDRDRLCGLVVKSLKDRIQDPQFNGDMRWLQMYEVMWICSQNMRYQDFYRAWHSS
jgi:energy-coupling factor transporter ATP-binding protein EcfA2